MAEWTPESYSGNRILAALENRDKEVSPNKEPVSYSGNNIFAEIKRREKVSPKEDPSTVASNQLDALNGVPNSDQSTPDKWWKETKKSGYPDKDEIQEFIAKEKKGNLIEKEFYEFMSRLFLWCEADQEWIYRIPNQANEGKKLPRITGVDVAANTILSHASDVTISKMDKETLSNLLIQWMDLYAKPPNRPEESKVRNIVCKVIEIKGNLPNFSDIKYNKDWTRDVSILGRLKTTWY